MQARRVTRGEKPMYQYQSLTSGYTCMEPYAVNAMHPDGCGMVTPGT